MAGSSLDFKVTFDDAKLQAAFEGMASPATDISPVFREVGEYLDLAHRLRWDRQVSPDGKAWAPLASATVRRKARKGKDRGLLLESRDLRDLLRYQVSGASLFFGTDRAYGATHQFGRPEDGIPARPWLGTSDDDEDAIADIWKDHFSGIGTG